MGYGSCWMTAPVLAAPAIEELLGVEPPLELVGARARRQAADAAQAFVAAARRGRPRVPVTSVSDPGASIGDLCARILGGAEPDERDLEALLRAGDEAPLVFAAAREMRARHSGDAVFLYGFVYFSTYCRNECAFCFYRADNDESPRYRKTADEVVAICRDLAASGVVLLDLTMGEDPAIHDEPGHAALLDLVGAVVRRDGRAGDGLARRAAGGVAARAQGGRGRLVRAVPGDPHARSSTSACAWGSRSRRAPPRAARPGAPACSWRTACSPASATPRPTAPAPSSPCARPAGSRCAS